VTAPQPKGPAPVADIAASKARAKAAEWKRGLLLNDEGNPKRFLANTLHVLSLHPSWGDVLAYDDFGQVVVKRKAPPTRKQDGIDGDGIGEWTEADSVRTAAWFASEIGFEPPTTMVDQAVAAAAERTRFHPVRDYLRSLKWDGTPRTEHFLDVYFGAPDTAYTRAVGARWLISAVARVMQPGCQADCMLILESEKQGAGKSTGAETLASKPWFSDTGIHIGDKDSYQALRSKWIYEFGELSAIKGREVERVKAFVSARKDTYRPSYGRRTRDFPRQCVFVGTTNDSQYLTDRTGNRRFWPVQAPKVNVDALARDRDQLWAEAVVRYEQGEPWHVNTPELQKLCEAEQREREPTDDWVELVSAWLETPTKPVLHTRSFGGAVTERAPFDITNGVTTADVLLYALDYRRSDLLQAATTRAGHVLRRLGWLPGGQRTDEDGSRPRVYHRAQPAQPGTETGCADEPAGNTAQNTTAQPTHPICTHTQESLGGLEGEGVASELCRLCSEADGWPE
jgi:putative DNA primase/helicase